MTEKLMPSICFLNSANFSFGTSKSMASPDLMTLVHRLRDRSSIILTTLLVAARSDELAKRIRSGTTEMPDPPGTNMFDAVYAEQTPHLAAQQAEFEAYQASFEGGGQ